MPAAAAFDPATLAFYGIEAEAYAARPFAEDQRFVHPFLDQLTPGARILELGCGGGRDSEIMLARGFDVDATDGCPEMAGQASRRLGRAVRVDLNNFRLLFDLRVIDVGVIVTRCTELNALFVEVGRDKQSYGQSTTHMNKLLPRMEGGGGGGCPVVAFGIRRAAYVDDRIAR